MSARGGWWDRNRMPFDPARRCPKCGNAAMADHVTFPWASLLDAIRRTCYLCSYQWDEIPLDRPSPTDASASGVAGEETRR